MEINLSKESRIIQTAFSKPEKQPAPSKDYCARQFCADTWREHRADISWCNNPCGLAPELVTTVWSLIVPERKSN